VGERSSNYQNTGRSAKMRKKWGPLRISAMTGYEERSLKKVGKKEKNENTILRKKAIR